MSSRNLESGASVTFGSDVVGLGGGLEPIPGRGAHGVWRGALAGLRTFLEGERALRFY